LIEELNRTISQALNANSSDLVVVDNSDNTPGTLGSKIVAGSNITITKIGTTNKQLEISATGGGSGESLTSLTQNTTWYITPSGNESNNGLTAQTPISLQEAVKRINGILLFEGWTLTLDIATGEYGTVNNLIKLPEIIDSGTLIFKGQGVSTNIIGVFGRHLSGEYTFRDLQITRIDAWNINSIRLENLTIIENSEYSYPIEFTDGQLYLSGTITLSGTFGSIFNFYDSGKCSIFDNTTFVGTATCNDEEFFFLNNGSSLRVRNSVTSTGTFTGRKFTARSGAFVDEPANTTLLPGNANGISDVLIGNEGKRLGFDNLTQIANNRFLGNVSGSTAEIVPLTFGTGFSFSGNTVNVTATGGGSGTVTSVGLNVPNIFTVSGSPVTNTGTLSFTLNNQNQRLFLASPTNSNGTPTFRGIDNVDLPGELTSTARVNVKKGGVSVGSRRNINFIEGSNVTLSISEDVGNEEIDVTINATGSGGGGSALTVSDEGTTLTSNATSFNFTGSGVTATNTGGAVTVNVSGGGSSLTTSVITSNTTAVSNTRYLCNTSSGSFTLTLPASPANGDVVEIADFNNSSLLTGFGVNPLTITANTGHNIVGNTNLVLDRGGQGVELVFHTNRWSIVSGIGESNVTTLSTNNNRFNSFTYYWNFDKEVTGNKADEIGGLVLSGSAFTRFSFVTPTNKTLYGLRVNGTESVSVSNNTNLQLTGDFEIIMGVYCFSTGEPAAGFAGNFTAGTPWDGWMLNHFAGVGFRMSSAHTGNNVGVDAIVNISLVVNTPYLLNGYYRASDQTLGMSVNGSVFSVVNLSGNPRTNTRNFQIGNVNGWGLSNNWGVVFCGISRRLLTDNERNYIYNNGDWNIRGASNILEVQLLQLADIQAMLLAGGI
jgi:hypothetical protein